MAELVLYSEACHALAAAKQTDEVKDIRDKAEAMRAYAKQAKNKQLETDAAEIRIRAERRLGELIRLQKETVGLATGGQVGGIRKLDGTRKEPSNRPPTLAEAGIDKKLSSRAQKMAAIPDDKFEGIVGEWRERVERENERVTTNLLLEGERHKNRSVVGLYTGEDEWYTPQIYIDAVRNVLGSIDLDPASNDKANKVVGAATYYTKEDSGLDKEWHGTAFLNPPYKQPLVAEFTRKLVDEFIGGRVTAAILLTNNSTDTKWWQHCAAHSDAACFTAGRISFYRDREYNAPTNGQVFLYFGDSPDKFCDEFSAVGWCAVGCNV